MSDFEARTVEGSEDFSIVLGGPLYQLYLKTHIVRTGLENLRRRLLAIPTITWAPLVALALIGWDAAEGSRGMFLRDIEVHARFLASIPLMILAEFVVHQRISGIVRQFVDRGLIAPEDMPRLEAIKASSMKLRNSVAAEIIQLIVAVGIHWMWGRALVPRETSWVGTADGAGGFRYSAAGFWYVCVSMPVFRFMLLRWYYRIFIWYRFLWKVGRLNLRLDALHPDRAAGLGFLSGNPGAFMPLMLAHSVLIAAFIQNRIWTTGATLADFKVEIVGVLVFALILALTPLFFFVGRISKAKRKANAEYGVLASRYVSAFREKWLARDTSPAESLIGSADIQSLSDLSGAYDAVRETRLVPLTRQSVTQLLVVTAIPLMPLTLNVIPFEDLLKRAAGMLF